MVKYQIGIPDLLPVHAGGNRYSCFTAFNPDAYRSIRGKVARGRPRFGQGVGSHRQGTVFVNQGFSDIQIIFLDCSEGGDKAQLIDISAGQAEMRPCERLPCLIGFQDFDRYAVNVGDGHRRGGAQSEVHCSSYDIFQSMACGRFHHDNMRAVIPVSFRDRIASARQGAEGDGISVPDFHHSFALRVEGDGAVGAVVAGIRLYQVVGFSGGGGFFRKSHRFDSNRIGEEALLRHRLIFSDLPERQVVAGLLILNLQKVRVLRRSQTRDGSTKHIAACGGDGVADHQERIVSQPVAVGSDGFRYGIGSIGNGLNGGHCVARNDVRLDGAEVYIGSGRGGGTRYREGGSFVDQRPAAGIHLLNPEVCPLLSVLNDDGIFVVIVEFSDIQLAQGNLGGDGSVSCKRNARRRDGNVYVVSA